MELDGVDILKENKQKRTEQQLQQPLVVRTNVTEDTLHILRMSAQVEAARYNFRWCPFIYMFWEVIGFIDPMDEYRKASSTKKTSKSVDDENSRSVLFHWVFTLR